MFVDDRTKELILLLLNEKSKSDELDNGGKSRDIDFNFDNANDESDDENEKEGNIEEIQISREDGSLETDQIVQEDVTKNEKEVKDTLQKEAKEE